MQDFVRLREIIEMRHGLMAATSSIVLALATGALAADISEDGAHVIRDNLNRMLPENVAKSAPFTVTPEGSRYKIVYDFAQLMSRIKTESFDIKGLTPFAMFAKPLDSGLWDFESNHNLNVTGYFLGPDKTRTDFTYSIADMVFNAVFDPAISYFRSSDLSAKGLRLTSSSDTEVIDASFGNVIYKLNSAESATAGRLDFAANGTLSTFVEKVSSKDMPPIQISADSLDFTAKLTGVAARELKEMVVFVRDRSEEKQLTMESERKLKEILGKAFPLLSSLEETVGLNNVAVTSAVGSGGAKSLGYHFKVDGPSNATRIGMAMNAADVTLDSAMVPAAYTAFLPQALDIQFGVGGMNFAALGDAFMKMDFTTSTGDSEMAGQKAVEELFPGGILTVDFPKISAKSSVYDIDVSGDMEGSFDQQKGYKVNASILARDYDKTIAAVQELAKADPELNQASFGLMMIKGFAKTDPDGAQRWDVAVASDGSVSVNGQQIKGPDAPTTDAPPTDQIAPSDEGGPSEETAPSGGSEPD
ncbi:hypothetical protein [Rhizobium sp. Leaf384]|uniref:hypothetical protein n=1 Tax=Rhizobium sp. Leaf384 TaxID=1736358 RepID=UPI000B0B7B91|nr:hypothetical protein [Rhizobium sp. Leaf384]